MTDRITGPIPIDINRIPAGVVLDMTALTRLIVGDVLDALLDPDDTGAWDRLHELAEGVPATDGRLPYEELEAELVDRASSRVPLYGARARELAERLYAAAGVRRIPTQREAGAA
ncbi:hypothetical protein [Streptomyces sp. DH12]|uniref:hypothetical protein n=1 Tax=Streptomyces sp. DH12 TaxID=2857010 RepID=UPI001E52477B|nr:hypothetical protein [Streptomyces sp. DH12]